MAGIYIHIPFCRKACHYCNFHFTTSLHQKAALVEAIALEISATPVPEGVVLQRNIETVYFGGGTPSILTIAELQTLLDAVRNHFSVAAHAEITLEANPDDIVPEKLEAWRQMGINRLSIGIQSFAEEDLRWMNRAHNAAQATGCISLARSYGFSNLTIDLIYGTPTLTDEQWLRNMQIAIDQGITHLSSYALTVEEKTALNHFIEKGKIPPVDEAKQSRHFDMLMDFTAAAGFEHYEVSNFARPGHRSRHNSNYWSGQPYYAFGPAAHSFDGQLTRWWNIANNPLYREAILAGKAAYTAEKLSPQERLNEMVMTGLRTAEGINLAMLQDYRKQHGIEAGDFDKNLQLFAQKKWITISNERVAVTRAGFHFADGIAAELFV